MTSSLESIASVLVAHSGETTSITFHRPQVLNCIDLEMSRALARLGVDLVRGTSRVIVLRGAGKAFMAGGDVAGFGTGAESIPRLDEIIENFHSFVLALRLAPQPVIAVVHGPAAGAGLSLAIGCDFAIAAAHVKLAFAYGRLGTSPDGACTYFLNRLVGSSRASKLLLGGEMLGAAEAHAMGMITAAVAPEQLEAEVHRTLELLHAGSSTAAANTKQLLNGDLDALRRSLAAEKQSFLHCAAGADFAEGTRAFLEKRPPRFTAPYTAQGNRS
jgi:2-(1,2-epoxy-1,2-dihydrophenyl)acetyl-CoA isomerase